jgi:hypothetical protein
VEVGHCLCLGEGGRQAGRGSGIAGWACGFEREVLLIGMELERLECGKAPPKYIGRPRRSVYLSSLELFDSEIWNVWNANYSSLSVT